MEDIVFDKSLPLLWDSFNRHIAAFLKQVFWKKSVFYVFYLHSAVVIPNFKIKLSYTKFALDKLSYLTYFMMLFTHFLFFDYCTLFFMNEFLPKTQKLSESMFLHNRIFINSLISTRWVSEGTVGRCFSK